MKYNRDQNGILVYKNVKRSPTDGLWYANVFFGRDPVTVHRRYGYRTRAEARKADISDRNALVLQNKGEIYQTWQGVR